MFLIILIIALKFICPLLYTQVPFVFGWLNFILDSIDGDLLIPLGLDNENYQRIDKAADYFTYVLILYVARKWIIRREIIITFIIRTVGQALFFLTNKEIIFFFFPNFLEPIFLVFVTIQFFKKDKADQFYMKHKKKILIGVFIYKMIDEWVTHVGNVDRTEFFALN